MSSPQGISKSPTGIGGFDDLTLGGVPTARPTLVCGSAGCGKTLFATTFLIHGARDFDEPGVFVTFEERPGDIVSNVASLGFALNKLVDDQKIAFEYIALDRSELEEAGDYDLEGLFIRLEAAIDSVGAKRVVLDTIESLFSVFSNEAILRAEIRRLFDWLKDKGMTTVITAERGDGTLTRQGLEEYVSDCVILLDHRVQNQVSTRRLRIVKYRGTAHGTNEYPFLIDQDGFSVLPVSSLGLDHKVFEERIPSGIADLDDMLTGGGFHRASSVLVSGVAGSGKSSVAASFAHAACAAGERALYFSFEESADQAVRNMKSIGMDIGRWIKSDKLQIHRHKADILQPRNAFGRDVARGHEIQPQSGCPRSDLLLPGKRRPHGDPVHAVAHRRFSEGSWRDRGLYPPHARPGWPGPNRRRPFIAHGRLDPFAQPGGERRIQSRTLSAQGPRLVALQSSSRIHHERRRHQARPSISGENGALTGSARKNEEAKSRRADILRKAEVSKTQQQLQQKRRRAKAQMEALQAELDSDEIELKAMTEGESEYLRQTAADRMEMERSRKS